MKFSLIAAALSVAGLASAGPVANGESSHQLETRATRSAAGWYAYGCYKDCYNGMHRALDYRAYVDKADNTPNKCIAACQAVNTDYKYIGLQFQQECWCGLSLNNSIIVGSNECRMRCTDGNHCGDGCRNNIWSYYEKPGH